MQETTEQSKINVEAWLDGIINSHGLPIRILLEINQERKIKLVAASSDSDGMDFILHWQQNKPLDYAG